MTISSSLDAGTNPVSDPVVAVKMALAAGYRDYVPRVRALVEGLSDEQVWTRPFGYGNSFGHLLLHLTGNLNFYIGACIGGSGYQRDREREFAETDRLPLAGVLADFERAVEMVIDTLQEQSPTSLCASFEAPGLGRLGSRVHAFVHCGAHIHHHIGQMIYLRKELERQSAVG